MKVGSMTRIVDGIRYDTEKATLLADDCYWDGHNFERSGRNRWLFRTSKGRYFVVSRTLWQGEQDTLSPVSLGEALALFTGPLSEHEVEYEEAFPEVEVEEA